MKKLTIGISIFAMLGLAFTFAGGASAMDWNLDGAAVLNFNNATVSNGVASFANTGNNELKMEAEGNGMNIAKHGRMNTGEAGSMVSILNQVNYNEALINQRSYMDDEECGCEGLDIALVGNFNNAMVSNEVVSGANTGNNELKMEAEGGMMMRHQFDEDEMYDHNFNLARGGVMNTGNAGSWVEATSVVNTNITRIVQ